jgi:hypothetical protein
MADVSSLLRTPTTILQSTGKVTDKSYELSGAACCSGSEVCLELRWLMC